MFVRTLILRSFTLPRLNVIRVKFNPNGPLGINNVIESTRNEESRYFIEHIYKTIQISMAQGAENLFDIFEWYFFGRIEQIFFFWLDIILLKPVDVPDVWVVLRILLVVILIKLRGIIIIIHGIAKVLDVTKILLMLLRTFVWSTNPLSTRTNAK